MYRLSRLVLVLFLMLVVTLSAVAPAAAQGLWPPSGCLEGTFDTGATWLICMPARIGIEWNGDLVVYAHGYVSPIPQRPPELPADQYVLPDGTSIPNMINILGYAFATTSYRTNGLAIKDGVADLVQLVEYFGSQHPSLSRHTYLVGASEGGLVTARAIEQRPGKFSGGVAACGPVGDFQKQVNYLGDLRVVFDYFYPGILTGSAIKIPDSVISNWPGLQATIPAAMVANPAAAMQLLNVTQAAVDPADPTSPMKTVLGVLWYNVFATNDATAKLHGNPFDNWGRIYSGSLADGALNAGVERYKATKAAPSQISNHYQTNGNLSRPLALLHNTLDPVVPYWHETLYAEKVGLNPNYMLFPVARYGHCNFTSSEIMAAFQWVVLKSGGLPFAATQDALPSPEAYQRFLELMSNLRP